MARPRRCRAPGASPSFLVCVPRSPREGEYGPYLTCRMRFLLCLDVLRSAIWYLFSCSTHPFDKTVIPRAAVSWATPPYQRSSPTCSTMTSSRSSTTFYWRYVLALLPLPLTLAPSVASPAALPPHLRFFSQPLMHSYVCAVSVADPRRGGCDGVPKLQARLSNLERHPEHGACAYIHIPVFSSSQFPPL